MNYGFIKPKIDSTHYVLGGSPVPMKVIQEDGNWETAMVQKDIQRLSFDTYNCTSFGTLKQIQTYLSCVFGDYTNYSDRWVGIIAGTKPPGNDPQKVYEAIRKYGLIPEEMLPFSEDLTSVEEYYSFKGADKEACYAEGLKWLEKYTLLHEWVFSPDQPLDEKINNMKVALKYSPLCLAVYAWAQDEKGVYIRLGDDTHWTFMYSYDDLERIMDSYEPLLKGADQEIFYCKRIHIEIKKPSVTIKLTLWQKILNWLSKQFNLIKYFDEATTPRFV